MSEILKPQFFVLRQNGSLVPLIAMDEMPHNIRIEGVPRTMTLKDTVGMVNIGEYPSRHGHHQVQDTNSLSETYKHISSRPTRSTRPSMVQDARLTEQVASPISIKSPVELFAAGPKKAYGIEEQPPSDSELENTATVITPKNRIAEIFGQVKELPAWKDTSKLGPRELIRGKKIYCTHWMSTGECDYAQQGCLYKHEMPLDIEILNFLGYQDIPKWYREQHGMGRLTATPGSGASISGPNLQSAAASAGSWRRSPDSNPSSKRPKNTTDRGSPRPNNRAWRGNKNQSHHTSHQQPASLIDLDRPEQSPRPQAAAVAETNTRQSPNQLYNSRFATSQTQQGDQILRLPNAFLNTVPTSAPARPGSNSRAPFNRSSNKSFNKQSNTVLPTFAAQSRGTSNANTPQSGTMSRRSSLYSDIETEFIRENELRRKNEEAEYQLAVKAKKDAATREAADSE